MPTLKHLGAANAIMMTKLFKMRNKTVQNAKLQIEKLFCSLSYIALGVPNLICTKVWHVYAASDKGSINVQLFQTINNNFARLECSLLNINY